MSKKFIYLVTHGEKTDEPNPGMTDTGKKQVNLLLPIIQKLMPEGPAEIHCGTGKRQKEVVLCLTLPFTDTNVSDIWGGPASLIKTMGEKTIMLSDGTMVVWDKYKTGIHLGGSVITEVIRNLPNNSIICSGRPVLVRMGVPMEECQSGALYRITVDDSSQRETLPIELIQSGVILDDVKSGGANV